MKVAVVGAGAWGKNIVRTLHELGALAAVVDVSPAIREQIASSYPGVTVSDEISSIAGNDIKAVAVATSAPTHYGVVKTLLEAGEDVFVEKPMALSVAEAEELAGLAERGGRVLMVGHLLLYQPAVQWLKTELGSGALGRVVGIHQTRLGLGRARKVENVLWSLGVHDVAVALYLAGSSPESVMVSGQRIIQPGIEDDVHLEMGFGDGLRAYLHCSWLWPERERRTVVVGSRGILVYNELEQTITLHRKSIDSALANVDDGCEVVYQGSGEPLKLEMQHFLDCIGSRATPISHGRSGVEVVRVLQTASERLTL